MAESFSEVSLTLVLYYYVYTSSARHVQHAHLFLPVVTASPTAKGAHNAVARLAGASSAVLCAVVCNE